LIVERAALLLTQTTLIREHTTSQRNTNAKLHRAKSQLMRTLRERFFLTKNGYLKITTNCSPTVWRNTCDDEVIGPTISRSSGDLFATLEVQMNFEARN
jgi:hypothetical protein